MNQQRVLDSFLSMVRIDSPSFHEAAMAAYCKNRLECLGFSVSFDTSRSATGSETDQIIAHRNGASGARHIALSAHMDCVIPCTGVNPIVENGVVRSDGTTVLGADDKCGIAAIFEAIESLDESGKPAPEITVLLSVCEEQSVAGAPHYPETLFDTETLCLVLDAAGSPGTVVNGAPYHYVFTATLAGKATHAGVEPELGINAISMAARAMESMPLGRLDETTTANVGLIEGGRATNIVPDTVVLRGECRGIHKQRADEVKQQMDDALRAGAQAFGGTVDIDWHLSYPGIYVPETDPDVQMLLSVASGLGLPAHCEFSGGGSDANVLAEKGAKPIPLGTGMTNFHSLNETVKVADLCDCARFVEEILVSVGSASH